ncbi:hypothetical protein ACOSQ4_016873 [Xanthoceras sorbifolium]
MKNGFLVPFVQWLGHRLFMSKTRVRFPLIEGGTLLSWFRSRFAWKKGVQFLALASVERSAIDVLRRSPGVEYLAGQGKQNLERIDQEHWDFTLELELPISEVLGFSTRSSRVPRSSGWTKKRVGLYNSAVPSSGVKCDVVPGRLNQISILVQREGVYYGQCSEICGTNHAFMRAPGNKGRLLSPLWLSRTTRGASHPRSKLLQRAAGAVGSRGARQ